jgi:hypothetical protein
MTETLIAANSRVLSGCCREISHGFADDELAMDLERRKLFALKQFQDRIGCLFPLGRSLDIGLSLKPRSLQFVASAFWGHIFDRPITEPAGRNPSR